MYLARPFHCRTRRGRPVENPTRLFVIGKPTLEAQLLKRDVLRRVERRDYREVAIYWSMSVITAY